MHFHSVVNECFFFILSVSSLKAQSTTPTSSTGPSIDSAMVNNKPGGFLSSVSARKDRERGAQVIIY